MRYWENCWDCGFSTDVGCSGIYRVIECSVVQRSFLLIHVVRFSKCLMHDRLIPAFCGTHRITFIGGKNYRNEEMYFPIRRTNSFTS